MRHVLLAVALFAILTREGFAQEYRIQFMHIKEQEQTEPAEAFHAMMALAETGYTPAVDRTGYYYRKGVGTQKNLEMARLWYKRAVKAEHPWSFASLARVEIELDRNDAAFEVLQTGALENRPGVRRLLATSHIDRKLGVASDPELGRRMLESLSTENEKKAARDLIVRINWGRLNALASDGAVSQVVEAGLAGDARFAEAALIYLSRKTEKDVKTVKIRKALTMTPGIRDQVLSAELVRLAAINHPRQFWSKTEEILANTETQNYAHVASTVFWINKNAWVRALQIELRALGYYRGGINARMTARTIRAQNSFCRNSDIWSICATGPLRGATVRAVAGAIATSKRET